MLKRAASRVWYIRAQSACCDAHVRSVCAALGYGQLHIVDSKTSKYKQSARTSRGAEKWLDVHMWQDTAACIERMRQQGRQVLVTHLDADAVPITVRLSPCTRAMPSCRNDCQCDVQKHGCKARTLRQACRMWTGRGRQQSCLATRRTA